jgi:hypothetical protein
MRNAHFFELRRKSISGIPANIVSLVFEVKGKACERIKMAIDGHVSEENFHGFEISVNEVPDIRMETGNGFQ